MSTEFINNQWRLPNNKNKDKQSNYSMDFDGVNGTGITTGSLTDLSISDTFSFSLWVKLDSVQQYKHILANSHFGNGFALLVKSVGGNLVWGFHVNGWNSNFINDSSAIVANQWYHIAVSWNNTNGAKMYINNGSAITGLSGTTLGNLSTNIVIGASSSVQYAPIGQIDAVSIFNYELSSSQITTLYGSSSTGIGNPMSLSPVAYYPLGDQDAFNGSSYLTPNASLKDFVFDFIDGNNTFVDCGANENILDFSGNNYTVSAWVNWDGIGDANQMIASVKSSGSNVDFALTVEQNDGKISYWNGSTYVQSNSAIPTNAWCMVTVIVKATQKDFFINGVADGTPSQTRVATAAAGTNFLIGKSNFGNEYFNGKISNLQIFNTALPATGSNSVETLYNNGSPLTSMSGFTSLQGWWKLDASATYDSSTTTWTIPDDSTNSNTGTSSGMTQANLVQSDLSFKTSISPYALDFDAASSDYIDCGNDSSLNLTSEISLSAWVKTTDQDSTNNIIKKDDGASNRSWNLSWRGSSGGGSRLVFWNWSSDGSYNYLYTSGTPASNFADGNWHNVVATYDGTTDANAAKIYLDGVLMSQGAISRAGTGLDTTTANVTIGNDLTASISNVSIWNAALTSAQVTELYNEGVPQNLNNHSTYSNLVSWWQLGSNSSFNTNWTVLDEKGSNNGTSANMGEDAITDGVNSYANGLSSGMGGDEVIGDAPYSSSNALSVNMDVEDRVTDTPS
jgi:hypothetical protein